MEQYTVVKIIIKTILLHDKVNVNSTMSKLRIYYYASKQSNMQKIIG